MRTTKRLDPRKFIDPLFTVAGEERACVQPSRLKTLWVNTGTLCNITCANCYIESSPRNDRLVYLKASEVRAVLEEIEKGDFGTAEMGFTGGEPFLNPEITAMLEDCLSRKFQVLILTNAMKPMQNKRDQLLGLNHWFGDRLKLRVSIDHYEQATHEAERGIGSWASMLEGIKFLSDNNFQFDIAGRTRWNQDEDELRDGFSEMFDEQGIKIDAHDPVALTLFPEMDQGIDVPEITSACWDILGVDPGSLMCATSRMLVKRKGASKPSLVACTLLPYDKQFEMGETVEESWREVSLNHPHCAKFCVLGGGSCSAG